MAAKIRQFASAAFVHSILISALFFFGNIHEASADTPRNVIEAMDLPFERGGREGAIAKIQTQLSWIGLFQGSINGKADKSTHDAIRLFQRGIGDPATGRLTPAQQKSLEKRSGSLRKRANFRTQAIDWVGMQLDVPLGYITGKTVSGSDNLAVSLIGRKSGSSLIWLDRRIGNATVSDWQKILTNWAIEKELIILANGIFGPFSYQVASNGNERRYYIYETRARETRGIQVILSEYDIPAMIPAASRILSNFEPFHSQGVNPAHVEKLLAEGEHPGAELEPNWYKTVISNGSGSLVSRDGHILTNQHVAFGCDKLTINGADAFLVGADAGLDLAVIKAPRLVGREPIKFAPSLIELGEPIFVLGYPVHSISPSLNATSGVVSSATGLFGDRTRVQISAPVQPGNSGGPVLSRNGSQVAVVSSKISLDLKNKVNIENIGYAVRSSKAIEFLETFGIAVQIAIDAFDEPRSSAASSAMEWRRAVVRVECHELKD
ncbi:MAG: serine protease [Albidovulum sp.]|nr:serine protease [Albidovulum sp.]MDE0304424.1 serine protease [Albidovulum sp.]MDE0533209.1 serine protease [Albidovulum sp.]